MEEDTSFIQNIINKKTILPSDVIIAPVKGDGNCFYRALTLYLTNDEKNYKTLRDLIYNNAVKNKEFIKTFFFNCGS